VGLVEHALRVPAAFSGERSFPMFPTLSNMRANPTFHA